MADEKKTKIVKVGDVLAKDGKSEAKPKSESKPKKSKVKHKHTYVEHHYNEKGKSTGHTVRHIPMGGGEEVSYAKPDLDGVHDGLEEHVGTPNEGEEEAQEQPEPSASSAPAAQV